MKFTTAKISWCHDSGFYKIVVEGKVVFTAQYISQIEAWLVDHNYEPIENSLDTWRKNNE